MRSFRSMSGLRPICLGRRPPSCPAGAGKLCGDPRASRRQAGGRVGDVRVVLENVERVDDVLLGQAPVPAHLSARKATVTEPRDVPTLAGSADRLDAVRDGIGFVRHNARQYLESALTTSRITLWEKV